MDVVSTLKKRSPEWLNKTVAPVKQLEK